MKAFVLERTGDPNDENCRNRSPVQVKLSSACDFRRFILVSCPSGSRHKLSRVIINGPLSKTRDAREDLVGSLGPDERFGIGVMSVDERADGGLKLGDAAMHTAADLLVRQFGEPALHQVQPRAVRRGEV